MIGKADMPYVHAFVVEFTDEKIEAHGVDVEGKQYVLNPTLPISNALGYFAQALRERADEATRKAVLFDQYGDERIFEAVTMVRRFPHRANKEDLHIAAAFGFEPETEPGSE
jgi:hypothetical protein